VASEAAKSSPTLLTRNVTPHTIRRYLPFRTYVNGLDRLPMVDKQPLGNLLLGACSQITAGFASIRTAAGQLPQESEMLLEQTKRFFR
jgi:hypothetical protein